MSHKMITVVALVCVLLAVGCINRKVKNPMAGVDSKQPDKGLFDNAMKAMKHGQYQEARTLLQTLINTYPDSEYEARAKLSVGDAWYAEGGSAAWAQAEVEYKDFQVFYPNMPESSEAQLKVATIHYRQMEKPDRDFVQAQRAAEEYKTLIQQYPDSPLVPEAKQRLREVQEVLAARQYAIANFYYLRDNIAAAQARLQSLIDSYPLYSGIDQALYDLGQLYEKEANTIRRQPRVSDRIKETLASEYQKHAVEAYSRIITRYPAMHRVNDARRRLQALNQPVPTPTAEALAESKAEEHSRHSISRVQKMEGYFKKHPNVAMAPGVGEPNMNEEESTSAPALVQDLNKRVAAAAIANQGLSIQAIGAGTTSGANQPAPGTASTAASGSGSTNPGTTTGSASGTSAAPNNSTTTGSGVADGAPPATAPPQVNEVPKSAPDQGQTTQGPTAQTQQSSTDNKDNKQDSSSKKKKKKGMRKLIPF